MQSAWSITDLSFSMLIADFGQTSMQDPHPVHFSAIENGRALCCARLPSGGAHPIARFLSAPPNPDTKDDDNVVNADYKVKEE